MTFVYAFDHPHDLPHDEVKTLIGGKGANLAVMTRDLGLPVPPGFTISTAACRAFLDGGWPEGLDAEIRAQIGALEVAVGRRFGDPGDPLLVSVRSGAPISMPGMMDTILNLGLNDATAAGFAEISGDPAFVEACRYRLATSYQEIVGVDEVPEDPWEQLRGAVAAVFRSWNSPRARAYREREGIPDDLGTGVNVQTMVFGNRCADSGTGVVFTRNPATGENVLYGDVMFKAQGEDVVAGTHQTEPIAVLAGRMPEIDAELRRYCDLLERHYADVCDIEFTIESGRLWMLQTRIGKRSPQAALRIAVEMAEDDEFPLSRPEAVRRVARYLLDPPKVGGRVAARGSAAVSGLGASPGLASGRIAVTADMAVAMAEDGGPVILVRPETSPDDVHGMSRAAGILTSTGGLASHAAVVARGWGIPAVVGAAAVEVAGEKVRIGGQELSAGDTISIDGSKGKVYLGAITTEAIIAPEAARLLEWAEELGIDLTEEGTVAAADTGEGNGAPEVNEIIGILSIKGFATPDALAEICFTTEEVIGSVLDRMTADGLTEMMGPMFKLSADGQAVGTGMLAADREAWGPDNAPAALEGFVPYDQRMKVIVTAWQMREVDGEQVLNDHTDADYDAGVLADLEALHAEVEVWMESLRGGLPRLGSYSRRLERAAELVAGGDHNYIASPRLDSYHNVWFELHEDLIRLAGRTREEETAAGRA